MAATWAGPDSQKEMLLWMIMNMILGSPQKFGDNPNTISKREAARFCLFYTYKVLTAGNSTSSTEDLPWCSSQSVRGWKYKFQ